MLALFLTLASSLVRAELVEAPLSHSAPEQKKSGPSTSSGRTGNKPRTAIEAERAFAADAQRIGQWAAFRKWAAADAIVFTPQPTNAQAWLNGRKEPAKAVEWWPTASWVSCDGSVAVNTGGSRWPDGRVGYFTTVWQRQPDGQWLWILDHGDALVAPRPAVRRPSVERARCSAPRWPIPYSLSPSEKGGASLDRTLAWQWLVQPNGARYLRVQLWDGIGGKMVVSDQVAARSG